MDEAPDNNEFRSLRLLRVLVTVLTAVMIVGFIILIGFLVTRFPGSKSPLALPERIVLPDGVSAQAFTQAADWYAVVTDGDEILIFDRADGALRQRIALVPAAQD
jgi:hypothetical protein